MRDSELQIVIRNLHSAKRVLEHLGPLPDRDQALERIKHSLVLLYLEEDRREKANSERSRKMQLPIELREWP